MLLHLLIKRSAVTDETTNHLPLA